MPKMRNYVDSTLLCEDVRLENTGREFALGIYVGRITVPAIPFVMPILVVRMECSFEGEAPTSFTLKVSDPNKNTLVEQRIQVSFSNWSLPGSIVVGLQGLIFPLEGEYTIATRKDEEDWIVQRTFLVSKVGPKAALEQMLAFKHNLDEQVKKAEEALSKR